MESFSVTAIHPASIKHALKGHPWITKDSFSSKWPKNKILLHIKITKDKTYTYLHDPGHSFCVGRLFHTEKITRAEDVQDLIQERLHLAVKNRIESSVIKQRSHYWLVFAEADYLPGLYINYLNGHVVLQTHIKFWENELPHLIELLSKILDDAKIHYTQFWWQKRSQGQHLPLCYNKGKFEPAAQSFWVEEAGIQMLINLGDRYDYGIYTDMAGIRQEVLKNPSFYKDKSVLNLFSYTGAFSVIALKNGAKYCCSLDSSKKYLHILEENLIKNNLQSEKHKSLENDFFKGLKTLQERKNQFDLIILDPPSSFTSKDKKIQAFQIYPEMLKEIAKIAAPKANLLCFLNYHQKTRSQFESLLKATLPQWKISHQFQLCQDASLLPYFPEGDYLKGILLERKS